jgi:hypothetical protein
MACGTSPTPDADALVGEHLSELMAQLWVGEAGDPPSMPDLLFRMAEDVELGHRIVQRAGGDQRAGTDSLLSFVSLGEPMARSQLPELHVIRDGGPPPESRPPAWSDVRLAGVQLLRRIAPDPAEGRDQRLLRELDAVLADGFDARPSEVGRLVHVWQSWWADRGHAPEFYLHPSQVPDIQPWLRALDDPSRRSTDLRGPRLFATLQADPLRRNLLLAQLERERHGYLTAECITVLRMDRADFERAGLPPRSWDPQRGKLIGFEASALRARAMEVLDRVTNHLASGLEEDELISDWLRWWGRGRFDARHWQDPRQGPTLETWLAGLDRAEKDGGIPMGGWLRELYLAEGFRDLILDEIGPQESGLVAELIDWLYRTEGQARDGGLMLAYELRPLRSSPGGTDGQWVAIPWSEIQDLLRELLCRITGEPASAASCPGQVPEGFWREWWAQHRDDPRWYRGRQDVPSSTSPLPTTPERSRSRG